MSEPTKTYEQECAAACPEGCGNGAIRVQIGRSYQHQINDRWYGCTAPTREVYEQSLRERLDATREDLRASHAQAGRIQAELRAANERADRLDDLNGTLHGSIALLRERAEAAEWQLALWKKSSDLALFQAASFQSAAEQREDALKLRVERLKRLATFLRGYTGQVTWADREKINKEVTEALADQPAQEPSAPTKPTYAEFCASYCPCNACRPTMEQYQKAMEAMDAGASTKPAESPSTPTESERERCARICEEYAAEMQSAKSS